jgi:hypothetical protein
MWNKYKYKYKYWEYNEIVHQIFTGFKKAYNSVERETLYNIFIVWSNHEISLIDWNVFKLGIF